MTVAKHFENLIDPNQVATIRETASDAIGLRINYGSNGHDATPFFWSKGKVSILSVMDGMGGRGDQKIKLDTREFTEAYFASRLIAKKLTRLSKEGAFVMNGEALSKHLSDEFYGHLKEIKSRCAQEQICLPPSSFGTMYSDFPTTFSMLRVQEKANGWHIDTFNCGDSRIYFFGLSQSNLGGAALTTDDTPQIDAWLSLKEDYPLRSYLSASKHAPIVYRQFIMRAQPFIALACTDGAHHYLNTPLELELLLYKTISNALSKIDRVLREKQKMFWLWFLHDLANHFSQHLHDDVSIAIKLFGTSGNAVQTLSNLLKIAEKEGRIDLLNSLQAGDISTFEATWFQQEKAIFERFLNSNNADQS